jgi:hypothetical protein
MADESTSVEAQGRESGGTGCARCAVPKKKKSAAKSKTAEETR